MSWEPKSFKLMKVVPRARVGEGEAGKKSVSFDHLKEFMPKQWFSIGGNLNWRKTLVLDGKPLHFFTNQRRLNLKERWIPSRPYISVLRQLCPPPFFIIMH